MDYSPLFIVEKKFTIKRELCFLMALHVIGCPMPLLFQENISINKEMVNRKVAQ